MSCASMAPPKNSSLTNLRYGGQIANHFGFNSLIKFVNSYPWIIVGTVKFIANKSVVVFKLFGEKFYFGLVTHLVGEDGQFVFICKVLKVNGFDLHYQGFEIMERKDFFHAVIPISHIIEFKSFVLHKPGFIKPKDLLGK